METAASAKRPRAETGEGQATGIPLMRRTSRPRYESSDEDDGPRVGSSAPGNQTVAQPTIGFPTNAPSLDLSKRSVSQNVQPSGLTSRVSQANLSGYDDAQVHSSSGTSDGPASGAFPSAQGQQQGLSSSAGAAPAPSGAGKPRKSRWVDDGDMPALQPASAAATPVPQHRQTPPAIASTAAAVQTSATASRPRFYGSPALYAHYDTQRAAREEIRRRYSQAKASGSATEEAGPTPSAVGTAANAASGSQSLALAAELAAVDDALPPLLRGCRSIALYKPVHAIDEGAYGKVWLGVERDTGRTVALKQFLFDKINPNEGFPVTALREINTRLSVSSGSGAASSSSPHPGAAHLVRIQEVVIGSTVDKVYMVMEYLPHNLRDYISSLPSGSFFTQGEVKCLLQQLLLGLACMHSRWLIHRDLKTANCLMDNEGRLCLCDFGLARRYGEPLRPYTDTVVTLWYRAPEVLLGSTAYGPALDLWSIGCIFTELLTKQPLFPSFAETAVINDIFKMMGTPRDTSVAPLPTAAGGGIAGGSGLFPGQQTWPGWKALPLVQQLRAGDRMYPPQPLRKALKLSSGPTAYATGANVSESGLSLLQGLLTLDPNQRLTAEEALAHAWFKEQPLPTDPRLMPAFPSNHGSASGSRR